jgi:cell division septation protein DedD
MDVGSGEQRTLYPYSLILASFRSLENALNTLSYYRSTGLSPYLVKVDLEEKGVWWRLYLGHYKTREEAQKVKKEQNFSDSLVKKTAYANLIGVFSSRRNIADMSRRLDLLGYFPYVIKEAKGPLRLFVGAFNTRKGVEEQNLELRANGIQSRVVKR